MALVPHLVSTLVYTANKTSPRAYESILQKDQTVDQAVEPPPLSALHLLTPSIDQGPLHPPQRRATERFRRLGLLRRSRSSWKSRRPLIQNAEWPECRVCAKQSSIHGFLYWEYKSQVFGHSECALACWRRAVHHTLY